MSHLPRTKTEIVYQQSTHENKIVLVLSENVWANFLVNIVYSKVSYSKYDHRESFFQINSWKLNLNLKTFINPDNLPVMQPW